MGMFDIGCTKKTCVQSSTKNAYKYHYLIPIKENYHDKNYNFLLL